MQSAAGHSSSQFEFQSLIYHPCHSAHPTHRAHSFLLHSWRCDHANNTESLVMLPTLTPFHPTWTDVRPHLHFPYISSNPWLGLASDLWSICLCSKPHFMLPLRWGGPPPHHHHCLSFSTSRRESTESVWKLSSCFRWFIKAGVGSSKLGCHSQSE